jgi:FtsK/SpoIIIE family
MPFVNVIRGERLPDAAFNVRTPILRVPLWAHVCWWCIKALFRLAVWYFRFWYVTLPLSFFGFLYLRYGWVGPVGFLAAVAAPLVAWGLLHRSSFARFAAYPALGRWRAYRYRRAWYAAMSTAGLTKTWQQRTVLPELRRVKSSRSFDTLTVRMVTGQIPDDYAAASLRLAHTYGALGCRVQPGRRPELVTLVLRRSDALRKPVAPVATPALPDLGGIELGLIEDGTTLRIRMLGTQILVTGATGAGKGSVLWSIVAALAGGVRAGVVKLWVFDPKGGMEFAAGQPLFDRFLCEDFPAMATALEQAVATLQDRTRRLRGVTRQHVPTEAEPLYVIVIDELATLTAYLADRQLKDRIKSALGVILTQGRAAGVHVVAAVQDPRKEVVQLRDLFPTRIALRLTEPNQVDMVLGDGMRDRGALCDRIPMDAPGVGYVVLDGDPTPVRARFCHQTDTAITDLAQTYGRLRVIEGESYGVAA